MTTTTTARSVTTRRASPSVLHLVAGSVLAPLVVWALAHLAGGLELQVRQGDGLTTVGPGAVVVVSLLASGATLGLGALLRRHTRRAHAVFLAVAGVTLLVSLAGPLGATTTAAGLALAAMHVAVAGVLVPGGSRRLHPRGPGDQHNG